MADVLFSLYMYKHILKKVFSLPPETLALII